MTFFKSFRGKIIFPTMLVLLALSVFTSFYLSIRFSAFTGNIVQEKIAANANSLNQYLQDAESNTVAAAISVAKDPQVIQAVGRRDRSGILKLVNSMPEIYRVSYLTFTDAKGVAIARTHEPDTFGDSLVGIYNIDGALEGRVSKSYATGGTIRLGIRTGVPIRDSGGRIIGAVSAGVRFDDDKEVERLKEMLGTEVTIFLEDKRIATTITRHGSRVVGTTLESRIAKTVLGEGQEYTGNARILGEDYMSYYKPIFNSDGQAFAAIFIGAPLAEMKSGANELVRSGLAMSIIGLAIAMVLQFLIIASVSRPISTLSRDTTHIAAGHLGLNVHINNEDEVGQLGKSIQEVVLIIRKLIEEINTMIYEHDHGNTDYCIDIDRFEGDYRILAANILDLAVLGIRDQLTGLANRRSFDNRLNIEWIRGIREKTATSLLIIDLDNFRHYNDTFGHHQGDAVLKAISMAICHCLKRDVDYVARWGSDKFIVLMPSTDARGALSVAERIRKEIEMIEFPDQKDHQIHQASQGHADNQKAAETENLTACIGVCSQIPMKNTSVDELVINADEALIKAKESGKNRVALKNEKTIAIF